MCFFPLTLITIYLHPIQLCTIIYFAKALTLHFRSFTLPASIKVFFQHISPSSDMSRHPKSPGSLIEIHHEDSNEPSLADLVLNPSVPGHACHGHGVTPTMCGGVSYWWCCYCRDGPKNFSLEKKCINDGHVYCIYCKYA